MVYVFLLFFLFCAPSLHASGWQASWSEEFNSPALDTSVWGYELGYRRNNEAQYYTNRHENMIIDSGLLVIRALREPWQAYDYTSASLKTSGKRSFRYGKFEMRARIDTREGSWPAWWWLPNSGGWPKGGEIDMMEFYQGKCLFNVMDGTQKWTTKTQTVASLGGGSWSGNFHVWTMVWDERRIDLSLDGVLMNHYLLDDADGTGPNGTNPFKHPGYFIVNQAIGGNNGGDPSKTDFPVEFRVDWIRSYVWTEGEAHHLEVRGGALPSDDYRAGERASLVAAMPEKGMRFDRWEITDGEAQIDDLHNLNTRIRLGNTDVTVMAIFAPESSSALVGQGEYWRRTGSYLRQGRNEKGMGAGNAWNGRVDGEVGLAWIWQRVRQAFGMR